MKNHKIKIFVSIVVITLINSALVFAQKKLIDTNTYKTWEKLLGYGISPDGKFAWNTQTENYTFKSTLYNLANKGQYDIPSSSNPEFSSDSKFIFFKLPGDTLRIQDLYMKQRTDILNVSNFTNFSQHGKEKIVYLSKDTLIIYDLVNKTKKVFLSVKEYKLNLQRNSILLTGLHGVSILNLNNMLIKRISTTSNGSGAVFDKSGTQVAFVAKQGGFDIIKYYDPKLDSARIQVNTETAALGKKYSIDPHTLVFSSNGINLFFKIINNDTVRRDSDVISTNVDVWSYTDRDLQSYQLRFKERVKNRKYLAIAKLNGPNIPFLLESDTVFIPLPSGEFPGNYLICYNREENDGGYYNPKWRKRVSIFNIETRKVVATNLEKNVQLSPTGKFAIWFDQKLKQHFSLETGTGRIYNISSGIPYPMINTLTQNGDIRAWSGVEAWEANEKSLFIADQYDLWQLDPYGRKAPVNITNGYGRKNHLEFNIALRELPYSILQSKQELILDAIDQDNYYNGFWGVKLGESNDPEKRTMGPFLYSNRDMDVGYPPLLKAKDADHFLITRQNASESPNLYFTTDLKDYIKLSDLKPEKKYNWLKSSLISYMMPDGRLNKAILYTPENLDCNKKYPVIFNYYQKRSDEVFQFQVPQLSSSNINIPFYVSNGYIVCVVDIINDRPGQIKMSTTNAVEGAAKYLIEHYEYVNASKFGLQGTSFGGYETNLLVANSSMFTAAQPSIGISSLVSFNGDLGFGGKAMNENLEIGQFNLQKSIWEDIDLYVKGSPVLQADKINTPLLILNNKLDEAVNWMQGVELYNAMRRLQKPCWLLQYDESGHGIYNGNDRLDFTIRQKQFFDHYLMGKPAPVWMTEGIPAIYKGLKSGLELDQENKQP